MGWDSPGSLGGCWDGSHGGMVPMVGHVVGWVPWSCGGMKPIVGWVPWWDKVPSRPTHTATSLGMLPPELRPPMGAPLGSSASGKPMGAPLGPSGQQQHLQPGYIPMGSPRSWAPLQASTCGFTLPPRHQLRDLHEGLANGAWQKHGRIWPGKKGLGHRAPCRRKK